MAQREFGSAKIAAPDVSSFAIHRPRLIARLDEALAGPRPQVLLVSAPAGFGKTTLLADWCARAAETTSVAWCSLDATEATPYRFWGLVLQALDSAGAGLAAAPPRRPGSSFPDRLADHLATHPGVVLILDNLQHVHDVRMHDDLDRLLDGLAGRGRLALVTRSDPAMASIQRHRLAGRLMELRIADLAFTRQETSEICSGLEAADQDAVWRSSEGWPAVLRLYQMASRTGMPAMVPDVLDGDVALADYLFGETLSSQSGDTQQLLMLAAVPVLLPLDLAVELTGRADAGERLDRVSQRTGLVTRYAGSDGSLASYRFHPLLRSHLRGRLALHDLRSAARAHSVAARYFLRAGLAVQALEHAVNSTDPVVLDEVLAACGAGLVTGGEADLLVSVLQTAFRRGGRVPDGQLHAPSWPGPCAYAVMAAAQLDLGLLPEAASALAKAHSLAGDPAAQADGADVLGVLLSAAEVHLRRRRGEPSPGAGLRAEPPPGLDPELRLFLAVQRGTALMWRGDWDAAERELDIGAGLARGLGRDAALIDCLTGLASVQAACSSVTATREYVDEALWLADARGWAGTPRVAYAHVLAAWAAWQELRPVLAREHLDAALAVLDHAADPTIVISARVLDAALEHEAERSPESARRLHSVWAALDSSEAAPSLVAYAVLTDMRFSLGLHRIGWAHDVMDLVRQRIPGFGEVQVVDAMVAASSGQMSRARQLVEPVAEGRTPTAVPSTRIEAHSVVARIDLKVGNKRTAVEHTRSALGLAAELGCMRPVTDAGGPELISLLRSERGRWGPLERVVEVLLERSEHASFVTGAQLTAREMDILQELPSLRTVEEIGAVLYLSPNTIKTHLRGIYRKLDVASRREAVVEGRRVGLL